MLKPRPTALMLTLLLAVGLAAPAAAHRDVHHALLEGCYDGDTCTFAIPRSNPFFHRQMVVHLRGVDAPELDGACDRERVLAREARDLLLRLLRHARRIELIDLHGRRKHSAVGTIRADGEDVADVLLEHSLANQIDAAHTISWCP